MAAVRAVRVASDYSWKRARHQSISGAFGLKKPICLRSKQSGKNETTPVVKVWAEGFACIERALGYGADNERDLRPKEAEWPRCQTCLGPERHVSSD